VWRQDEVWPALPVAGSRGPFPPRHLGDAPVTGMIGAAKIRLARPPLDGDRAAKLAAITRFASRVYDRTVQLCHVQNYAHAAKLAAITRFASSVVFRTACNITPRHARSYLPLRALRAVSGLRLAGLAGRRQSGAVPASSSR
jgi:hypothetical protein